VAETKAVGGGKNHEDMKLSGREGEKRAYLASKTLTSWITFEKWQRSATLFDN